MIVLTTKEARLLAAAQDIACRVYPDLNHEDADVRAWADAMAALAPSAGIANLGRKLGRNVPYSLPPDLLGS